MTELDEIAKEANAGHMTFEQRQIVGWLLKKHRANVQGSGGSWATIFAEDISADLEGFAKEALGLSDPLHEWCHYDTDDL